MNLASTVISESIRSRENEMAESSHAASLIQLERIHKVYTTGDVKIHALRGVSLHVDRGEFVAIMGTSGSGKSTMMNILGCLDRPSEGKHLLDGIDISLLAKDERADIRNRKIGFVFQGF